MQNLLKKIVKTCIEKDAHKKTEIMPENGGAYGTEICTTAPPKCSILGYNDRHVLFSE